MGLNSAVFWGSGKGKQAGGGDDSAIDKAEKAANPVMDAAAAAAAAPAIPWARLLTTPAIWALIINNFAFHYVVRDVRLLSEQAGRYGAWAAYALYTVPASPCLSTPPAGILKNSENSPLGVKKCTGGHSSCRVAPSSTCLYTSYDPSQQWRWTDAG